MKILEQPLREYLLVANVEVDMDTFYQKLLDVSKNYIFNMDLKPPNIKIPRRQIKTVKRDYQYLYTQYIKQLHHKQKMDQPVKDKSKLVEQLFKDIDSVCTYRSSEIPF